MLLLALLTACAVITKQKDFEVDLPLFEGDEEEAAAPEELELELKLYDVRKDWTMPAFLEVDNWGALMLADSALRAEGGEGFLRATVTTLSLDADPGFIEITFTLSSRDTRRYLLDEVGVSAPAACAIRVDETTLPEDFGDDLTACLEAWTDANGAPADLAMDALVTDTDLETFTFASDLSLGTSRPVEAFCSEWLVVDEELRAEADHVDINALELAGYAVSTTTAMDLVAFENTFPLETGDPNAGGVTVVQLAGAGGKFVGQEIEVVDNLPIGLTVEGTSPIDYFPDREQWLSRSTAALETVEGYVQACWVAAHAEETNQPIVHFTLLGDGHYDGRE